MTRKQTETVSENKATIKQIITLLNGETLEDAKNILDAVAAVLKSGLVDAESLKDAVDDIFLGEE